MPAIRQYPCTACAKSFINEQALCQHREAKHDFPCKLCNKFFLNQQALDQHAKDSPTKAHEKLRRSQEAAAVVPMTVQPSPVPTTSGGTQRPIQNSLPRSENTNGKGGVALRPKAKMQAAPPTQKKKAKTATSYFQARQSSSKPSEPSKSISKARQTKAERPIGDNNSSSDPKFPNHSVLVPLAQALSSEKGKSKAITDSAISNYDSRWSVVPTIAYQNVFDILAAHCHSQEELSRNGYRSELGDYVPQICTACGKLMNQARKSRICWFHPGKLETTPTTLTRGEGPVQPGSFRYYSCCSGEKKSSGCSQSPSHSFVPNAKAVSKLEVFVPTPPASSRAKLRAVTLDCEMVGVKGNMSEELISFCAIDYITGAVILHKLVLPAQRVRDWRSNIHGITASTMDKAVARGEALFGWEEARAELWKHIDADTIIVGHSLQYDLNVLRMIHGRVVDSAILARNVVGTGRQGRQWGLKTLLGEFLNVAFRDGEGGIHDCLEDTLATREVVLWCTQNEYQFQRWGCEMRAMEMAKQQASKLAREKKKAEKKKNTTRDTVERKQSVAQNLGYIPGGNLGGLEGYGYDLDDESDIEVVHWSDIAESCGWPHPDTGYDPWSD